jgi:hypothetical protein
MPGQRSDGSAPSRALIASPKSRKVAASLITIAIHGFAFVAVLTFFAGTDVRPSRQASDRSLMVFDLPGSTLFNAPAGLSKGFGRRQAYESRTCTTRGGLGASYGDFGFARIFALG